ncbi:MAG: hypothetical protein ACR2MQ_02800 [Gemmatimonadaceae bacterium]
MTSSATPPHQGYPLDPHGFFVRYQAGRELTEAELVGLVRGLTLLREERSILGWRLAHEHASHARVSLEIDAESEVDAQVRASIVFVEALAAARLEDEPDVFRLGETVSRA